LLGSAIQVDDLPATVDIDELRGSWLVIEEKLDGANAGLSFDDSGQLLLQSRGHYLLGGHRERHFSLFKSWATAHQGWLWERLGSRYLMYGEWLYAKHTIFYDCRPHYFHEFDIWDRERQLFLDTPSRRQLLGGGPIVSVPVLHQGVLLQELSTFLGPALYRSSRASQRLLELARELGLSEDQLEAETDPESSSEGLYLKIEEEGQVMARYKMVLQTFLNRVVDSETHWLDRPIVPNQLKAGVELFA